MCNILHLWLTDMNNRENLNNTVDQNVFFLIARTDLITKIVSRIKHYAIFLCFWQLFLSQNYAET